MAVGLFIGGALLALACGVLNGSWVVPTKANAPKVLRVTDALPWEAFWLIFNLSLIVFNGVVTVSVQGATLFQAIGQTDSKDVVLICFCFLGWGFGATGFGLSVKRVGVALGTALVLSAATVVGTVLPILLDFNAAKSQLWFLIAGVTVAVAGFAILGKANLMKDADLSSGNTRAATVKSVPTFEVELPEVQARQLSDCEFAPSELTKIGVSGAPELTIVNDSEVTVLPDIGHCTSATSMAPAATVVNADACMHQMHKALPSSAHTDTGTESKVDNPILELCIDGTPGAGVPRKEGVRIEQTCHEIEQKVPSGSLIGVEVEEDACFEVQEDVARAGGQSIVEVDVPKPKNEFWVNISICLVSGAARAMLNVGLVLGKVIEEKGQALGSSEVRSGMAVWFLGFNMCALPGIGFSAWLLWRNGTRTKLRWNKDGLTARRLCITMGSALTWVLLLHFYGVATFWLGPLGNAVAWPLLLTSTILSAQFWSQGVLGEWKGVTRRTMRVNEAALAVLILSVLITASGVFVEQYS